MKLSSRLQLGHSRRLGFTAFVLALAIGLAASLAAGASGPAQGKQSGVADFGIASPQTSDWDKGGATALVSAAQMLGAKPTWLSNIAFDQAPQVIDRLVAQKIPVIISNGSGYGDAMTQAAQKYPSTWFVVYSDLASTSGLKNLVGIRVHWNQIAYLAGMMACLASKTGKVGLVISQPIPAYAHAVGGMMDGVKKFCGSSKDLLYTWTGTFSDVSKTKQAAAALIAKGADVITDFQDSGTPGVIAAVKANPNTRYVGTMSDWTSSVPNQIIGSVYINYKSGYNDLATNLLQNKLKPQIYLSDAQTGGLDITKIYNTTPAVAKKINQAFALVKSGKLPVPYNHQVKQ